MCEREMCVTADKTNYKSVINTRTSISVDNGLKLSTLIFRKALYERHIYEESF